MASLIQAPPTMVLQYDQISTIITSRLQLWVFNPELRYSSSCPPTATANRGTIASQRAMKVFYQYLSSSKVESLLANELGERQPTSVGDLDLHSCGILEELDSSLKRSTEMLPVLARKFQEWNVGVMDRV